MGIRTIIAVCLGLAAASAQAATGTTNSWNTASSDYWDTPGAWSVGLAPTNTDTADFITNAVSKIVTIDDYDTSDTVSNTLVVSNVTVGATSPTTNTLFLQSMNDGTEIVGGLPIPLHILNGFTITNGGVLEITNSILQVDGRSGGILRISGVLELYDGALVQAPSATISSNAVLLFALGSATTSSPVVVNNNLTLGGTLDVIDGGGFATTNYTLFTYGGTLTYGGLAIGSAPSNSTCVVSTNTIGQVNLNVTVTAPASPLPFQIISIVRNTNDITVTWTTSAAGTNFVQAANGSYNTNNLQNIATNTVVAGTTNSYTDFGAVTNTPSRFYRISHP